MARQTHCLLGRTGVKVSRICLGSLNFGKVDSKFGERPGQLSEQEAHKILDRFVELGGNCIDTADFFPWFGSSIGETENIIGNWLKRQNREKIFIMTKVRMPTDPENVNSVGLSRSHIFNSVNCSLKRLQTNYIDMLVLNGFDPTVNLYETVRHLDDLVEHDKIRYIGVSDFKGWQLQRFIDASKVLNLHKCVCYLGEYNLLTRGCEWEIMDICRNERIGFIAYSPFKYGVLTSKCSQGKLPEGSRIKSATERPSLASMAESYEEIKKNPCYNDVLECCQNIAQKRNLSCAQVCILWALQKGFITSVVVGCNSVEELEENWSCLKEDCFLSQEEMEDLEEASCHRVQYPYNINLATLAGLREIDISECCGFEQLSLTSPEKTHHETKSSEILHEAKGQFFPEQQSLREPQMRSREQRSIN